MHFKILFHNIKYTWNNLCNSRCDFFIFFIFPLIMPRFVPRTPWLERGQETRDGGISSGRAVCPPPPGFKHSGPQKCCRAGRSQRRTVSLLAGVVPKCELMKKNVSHNQARENILKLKERRFFSLAKLIVDRCMQNHLSSVICTPPP